MKATYMATKMTVGDAVCPHGGGKVAQHSVDVFVSATTKKEPNFRGIIAMG